MGSVPGVEDNRQLHAVHTEAAGVSSGATESEATSRVTPGEPTVGAEAFRW